MLAEVVGLAEQGVREINLLGQNVNAYRGAMHRADVDGEAAENEQTIADLALLIHYVAAIDGIDRIRFTTSHPMEFNDDLVGVYAQVPERASFLHRLVKKDSDNIVVSRKRGHTADQ